MQTRLQVIRVVFGIFCAVLSSVHTVASAASDASPSKLIDSSDGWLDVSDFLDTAYGFLPVLVPITEPAVGYGAGAALVFIDRDPATLGQPFTRPNILAIGGMATENGSRGLFGGHLGTWQDGKLRTMVALADADVNLEFFGFGGGRLPGGASLDYSIAARGALAGGNYRYADTPLWFGLRYAQVTTHVSLTGPDYGEAGRIAADRDLRLAALTPSVTLDMRNNFFTPTQGWYVDLSVPIFREAWGSDRDFEKLALTAMHYRMLDEALFLSVRGSARTSTDGTPFYLRPFVVLRGVQALGYQGEQAAEIEAELRWQLHPRFSAVGFAGAGLARGLSAQAEDEQVTAGGAGFRYLIARRYGLHMGLDVAVGPGDPVIYVIFGSAWMRP